MSAEIQNALIQALNKLPSNNGSYVVYHFVTKPVLCKYPIELNLSGMFSQSSKVHRLIIVAHERSNGKPALVCGLEAMEYKMKTTDAAPSIAYVSKIDTTGYKAPAPITAILIESYLSSLKECNIHIFARAQPQYLFPESVKNASKRAQSDRGLIAWWLRAISNTPFSSTIDAWWNVPGVDDEDSAKREIRVTHKIESQQIRWHYGYPYDDTADAKSVIPNFPDDAKARLLKSYAGYDKKDDSEEEEEEEEEDVDNVEDESDNEGQEGVTKSKEVTSADSQNTSSTPEDIPSDDEGAVEDDESKNEFKDIVDNNDPQSMTVREFWQLLSIGEECGAGKLTGFFIIKCGSVTSADIATVPSPTTITSEQFTVIWNKLMSLDFSSEESNVKSTLSINSSIAESIQETSYTPTKVNPTGQPVEKTLKRPLQEVKQPIPAVNVLGGSFIKRKRT
ncbi:hypothetical protein INT43_000801 [Umbelopsis isabellina]|uniref:histone acetyltransferase n=1 Tax=Mortierella isabellina TaxID=91625 RepID=A0A8H7Q3Z8_MORIS|nr:hypothetical protein INT43_000801 [Umbelopsis isabellina]